MCQLRVKRKMIQRLRNVSITCQKENDTGLRNVLITCQKENGTATQKCVNYVSKGKWYSDSEMC